MLSETQTYFPESVCLANALQVLGDHISTQSLVYHL